MYWVRSFCPETVPPSVSNSLRRDLLFPARWKSKKAFEHVSPYLSQLEADRCRLCLTEFWNTSVSLLCEYDRIPLISSFVGFFYSWISANWIFLVQALIWAPWARFLSFERCRLHCVILSVAASSHGAQFWLIVGSGASPIQTSNMSFFLLSSLSRKMSK